MVELSTGNLRELMLNNNAIISLASLPALPFLERLSAARNHISSLSHTLSTLQTVAPNLLYLDLEGNPYCEAWPSRSREIELRAQAVAQLPRLNTFNGVSRADVPFWWLPPKLWKRIVVVGGLRGEDLAMFGSTCRLGNSIAKATPVPIPVHLKGMVRRATFHTARDAYPELKFEWSPSISNPDFIANAEALGKIRTRRVTVVRRQGERLGYKKKMLELP